MKAEEQYILSPLTSDNEQEIIKYLCSHYISRQPMSVHLNTTPQLFGSAYKIFFSQSCNSGLSFCFRYQNEIVASILAFNSTVYLKKYDFGTHFAPLEEIIQEIQKFYKPQSIQKTISIFIICTHPSHLRKNLSQLLLKQVIRNAGQKGYKQINAECTNKASENTFLKAGFEIQKKIVYDTFQFQSNFPFKGIKGAEHMSLVFKKL